MGTRLPSILYESKIVFFVKLWPAINYYQRPKSGKNHQNSFVKEYPSLPFDFSKLLLGDGFFAVAKLITVKSNGSGTLTFTWAGKKGRDSAPQQGLLECSRFL
jgi:hypothetical protein